MKENPALKYGLLGGIALVVIGIVMQLLVLSFLKSAVNDPDKFSMGKSILVSIGSLVLILAIFAICIVKAQKEYRRINPEYTYRKLVAQGLLATLILVVVSMSISYLYNYLIAPELKAKTEELTYQLYESMDIPEDQKEKILEGMKEDNTVRQILTTLGLSLVLGMIVSLISAMVLNKRNMISNQMR